MIGRAGAPNLQTARQVPGGSDPKGLLINTAQSGTANLFERLKRRLEVEKQRAHINAARIRLDLQDVGRFKLHGK